MQGKRSSILLYFDNFRRVAGLPDEQLGLLFRALMECGEAELDGRDGIAGCAERYPDPVDVQCGNRMVDAKSLLGGIALGLEKKLNLKIYGDNSAELLNRVEFCTVE